MSSAVRHLLECFQNLFELAVLDKPLKTLFKSKLDIFEA
jgi:hypothetical protein